MTIASAHAASAEVKGIRFGVTSPTASRVVIDIAGAPQFQLDGPDAGVSLSLLMTGSTLGAGTPLSGGAGGLVSNYDFSVQGDGSLLLRVTLKKYSKIKSLFSIPPSKSNPASRVVLDLVTAVEPSRTVLAAPKYQSMSDVIVASTSNELASQAVSPTVASAEPVSTLPPPAAPIAKPVIVIDAGHGGTDPGASGPDGAKESEVTLAAAVALSDALKATGKFEVVLTRSTDVRVAYEERTRIARDAHAGLFISLHADSINDSNLRGGSVYTLNKVGTERSAREALSQGDYTVFGAELEKANPVVGSILYSKAQEWTGTESDRFAQLLLSKLSGVTPLVNNSHRKGNLIVLLSPDVPAVLFELAYITNPKDEANLKSPAWRKRTMGAVANAIESYFLERAQAGLQASNTATAGGFD
ncbi:MAG: N-acetylmuramoyl-L-alanine amidase [Parvularculaceae bacterium]